MKTKRIGFFMDYFERDAMTYLKKSDIRNVILKTIPFLKSEVN